ncbi:hypothetical protein HDU83_001205 [Entophlyctis luteolus]|nr:hypothetical protein HDU83_001205 [Entophlyctis luteolus]
MFVHLGELDRIYAAIAQVEAREKLKVDLLIICGDFQSLRNVTDLDNMAVPDKYKRLGVFHEYYSGKKKAPLLTVFVGGNHEGSNYLWELYHGGWVAPNIYFMGFANVINVGGLRIAGMTGIFDSKHFDNGFHEVMPYNREHVRSIYHVRSYNEYRLSQISSPLDIFISHDWPRGIYDYGDSHKLLQQKPFFAHEVHTGTLGSEVNERLLVKLKPRYWFSAHLHVKFAALVRHDDALASLNGLLRADPRKKNSGGGAINTTGVQGGAVGENPDAIDVEDDSESGSVSGNDAVDNKADDGNFEGEPKPKEVCRETKFLALDKCLPRRDFLQILSIESDENGAATESNESGEGKQQISLSYDEEWLAIVRATDKYMSFERHPSTEFPTGKAIKESSNPQPEKRAKPTHSLPPRPTPRVQPPPVASHPYGEVQVNEETLSAIDAMLEQTEKDIGIAAEGEDVVPAQKKQRG